MSYKNISTVIFDPETELNALEAAADFARREDGHLEVVCLGIDRNQPGFYYTGASALTIQNNLAEAERDSKKVEAFVQNALEGRDLNWSTLALTVQIAGLTEFLAHHIRFSDIVVLAKPYGENRGHEAEAIVEGALFDAGAPILIIPDATKLPDPINRVVVGWNDSRESLHAIRLALPILRSAEVVNIAIVDPPAHAIDRSDPGGALSQMLARHGVKAEVSVLAKTLPRVSDVLQRHVEDQRADLIVMGAYGHSRFRESILGGATRNTLQTSKVPVFMAH